MRRAAALLLIGCGGYENPDDYAEARANAECGRIQTCDLGRYEADFSSDEDCVNERTDDIEANNNDLDDADCTFVPEEAGSCVSRIRGLSCEAWFEGESGLACDLVWDCSQDFGGGR